MGKIVKVIKATLQKEDLVELLRSYSNRFHRVIIIRALKLVKFRKVSFKYQKLKEIHDSEDFFYYFRIKDLK